MPYLYFSGKLRCIKQINTNHQNYEGYLGRMYLLYLSSIILGLLLYDLTATNNFIIITHFHTTRFIVINHPQRVAGFLNLQTSF